MFLSGYLILLVAVVCHTLPTNEVLSRHKRVIGGDKYGKGEHPYHASLWYMGENNPYTANTPDLHHTCGGSLIARQWVLTSAACFDDNYLPGLGNNSLWEIYLGMYAQTDAEMEAQLHYVDEVFFPPEYNLTQLYGDVALIKLVTPATLVDGCVGVVDINSDPDCPHVGDDVKVIGWGQTQNETYGLGSDVPHEAIVEVSNTKHCHERYLVPGGGNLRIDGRNLCAGVVQGGVDTCNGDSGSPLLAKCGAKGGHPVVAATASYGNGCAKPDYPAVYTRVSAYYAWIKDTMEANS